MKKIYLLFLVMCVLLAQSGIGQSTANYAFSTNTIGSLALDRNSNTVDMVSGVTALITVAPTNGDDDVSSVTNLNLGAGAPFEFWFMGTRYTQFSVNTNGLMRLGSTVIGGGTYAVAQSGQALIGSFVGDLWTNANVYGKVIGTAPNRKQNVSD
jgi:hypothetical protein